MKTLDLERPLPTKSVTISDVALALGVSKSTVSRAINDHPQISVGLRTQVLEQAREMGFAPSALARSLSRRSSNTIGVFSGAYFNVRSGYIAEVISGLQFACDENRLDLLLHGTFPNRSLDEICGEFQSGKIDGLVLLNPTLELTRKMSMGRVPVVVLVNRFHGVPCVVADERRSGELMAEFLLKRGHRHVLYRNRLASDAASQRLNGMRQVLQRAGATLIEEDVPSSGVTENERRLLELPREQRPTAVVGWEDDAAYEMLEHCRQNNIAVPGEVAVAGLNGVGRAGSGPQLTTIVASYNTIAQEGLRLILRQLRGQSVPRLTILPVELRTGETA